MGARDHTVDRVATQDREEGGSAHFCPAGAGVPPRARRARPGASMQGPTATRKHDALRAAAEGSPGRQCAACTRRLRGGHGSHCALMTEKLTSGTRTSRKIAAWRRSGGGRIPPGPIEAYSTTRDLLSWMLGHFERYRDIYKA
jgi:hypothetical protein